MPCFWLRAATRSAYSSTRAPSTAMMKSKNGSTALSLAQQNGYIAICTLLEGLEAARGEPVLRVLEDQVPGLRRELDLQPALLLPLVEKAGP